MGAVVGYGVALQASWLEGFDSLGLHQYNAALADVVIAPVWSTEERGSIPRGGTKFKDANSNFYTLNF